MPEPRLFSKFTRSDWHSLVQEALATKKLGRVSGWLSDEKVRGISLLQIYKGLDARNFLGHLYLEKYLEKEHGVAMLYSSHWSDERLHVTIAALLKNFPHPAVFWASSKHKVFGRTLSSLQQSAKVSNNFNTAKMRKSFFGHGNWKNYVEWLKQGYRK